MEEIEKLIANTEPHILVSIIERADTKITLLPFGYDDKALENAEKFLKKTEKYDVKTISIPIAREERDLRFHYYLMIKRK